MCTDTHYDYLHTGCDSIEASRATMAVVGCPTKAYINSNYLCGVLIDIDEDYVHSVGISAISIIYPRTLVEEARINGITQQRITCWNQFDCADKCDSMARKQHSGGLPAPPACALCNPPCPNNVAETIVGAIRALGQDITTALRLAALCLNPVACVCQASYMQTQTTFFVHCTMSLLTSLVLTSCKPDNCAGVHAAAPRVDRQPAQRAAGVLRARHHEYDPRQGGRVAARLARDDYQRWVYRPNQQDLQVVKEGRDRLLALWQGQTV